MTRSEIYCLKELFFILFHYFNPSADFSLLFSFKFNIYRNLWTVPPSETTFRLHLIKKTLHTAAFENLSHVFFSLRIKNI